MEKINSCDALKRLARQAKERLTKKQNFYEDGKFKVYRGGIIADYKLIILNDREDEKFYARVSEILTADQDVTNPIGRLVDKTQYSKLSDNQKQRYIFDLANKYLQMKERFEREQKAFEVV